MKGFWSHLMTAILGGLIVLAGFLYLNPFNDKQHLAEGEGGLSGSSFGKSERGNSESDSLDNVLTVGFGDAAAKSLQPVVHIRVLSLNRRYQGDYLGDNFWENTLPGQIQEGAGSGVIVTSDGYIVTNNHVVDNAREIMVTLFNKRTYKAEVVGKDPSTDLAVIKINAQNLPKTTIGNSAEVRVGDWVLAVGNPFNLASTVTAGIVSAKARNIHILGDISSVESFIQTDAAVNPGNSGGALVNLDGELIGINTAIATPTGTYAGYSFAVPSNIVKRVVEDIIEHGEVQRGYLGVIIRDLDWELSQRLGLTISQGVVIEKLVRNGAANQAGLKPGDVITKINGRNIRSTTELIEVVASHGPGDKVKVTIQREGRQKVVPIKLQKAF
ncbi:MAG TPA: trypsin-like peptidase domain-containing protein [Cytophagales bacterium]|nr:trypsin-like peptidase domain-containing protein [Cytophagales bacterium]